MVRFTFATVYVTAGLVLGAIILFSLIRPLL